MKLNRRISWISCISIIIVLVVSMLPAGCSGSSRPAPGEETRIIIFHVNDPHAKIDSYPKMAWLVAEARKTNPHVYLMNAGDNFSGNPVVDLANPKGEPVRLLMNAMGYDAMALGNHEFDYGQGVLKNFMQKSNFPVLCANVKVGPSGIIPQPEPFKILTTSNGIRIAVLGLIQVDKDNGIPATHPKHLGGTTFSNPLEAAVKYRHLRKDNQVFIALTHVGLGNETKLAKKMAELDLIIGGHSHTAIANPKETNGVLITQAGGHGQYIGRIELVVKDGKVIKKSGRLIKLS